MLIDEIIDQKFRSILGNRSLRRKIFVLSNNEAKKKS
jgi:hypothetical protein